ncbi:MAG TPA: Omp28-related outer membrane protein, partial [Salinivirgaceae bacterium]|nr:Omp28-related outer membrane protein [Salinivirgaceae bacterium]
KRVLLIEFTGFRCTNCPEAHAQINILKERYGDKLLPVAIHAGTFARPTQSLPYDYRTIFGTALHDHILPNSYPVGIVSSLLSANQSSSTDWAGQVEESLNISTSLSIEIENSVVNSDIKTNIKIKNTKPEIELNDLRLFTILVEDSVVGTQLFPGGETVNDYVHNHMLRYGFTASHLGDNIVFNNQNDFDTIYSVSIDEKWRVNKLSVVVFVTNLDDDVLQTNYKNIE